MDLIGLENILDNTSFAILLATLLTYWVGVAFPKLSLLPSLGTAGMAIANLTIAALLACRWIEAGYFPISNLYESLFFLAWGVTAMHLIAENMSRSRLVGAVTAPVAMGITAFAALTLPVTMQSSEPLVPALKSNWLMMHVSIMMLSYATLMVGAMLAIAFLLVTWGQPVELRGSSVGTGGFRLVSKRESGTNSPDFNAQDRRFQDQTSQGGGAQAVMAEAVMAEAVMTEAVMAGAAIANASASEVGAIAPPPNLPILSTPSFTPQRLTLAETLDNISYRMIGLGFPLLTIGIIAGAVWANEAWGSYWSWDPKETWAFITWLVFAAYLHSRITRGWQGRKPALLAATGFLVVWICYLGVNLLGKGLHSYGWFF